MPRNKSLLVNKNNLFDISQMQSDLAKIKEGEVLFEIKEYAFTANNVTYAVCGNNLKYWDFFPAETPNGIIPVWGYAKIIDSNVDEIKNGNVYYGFFPTSGYLVVQPGKVNPFGFSDLTTHRQHLSPIYNHYSSLAADPTYNEINKPYIPIVKPLFTTSFLIYHFLSESNFFETDQIILTCASSKTALALASMFKSNNVNQKVIGITSKKNVSFVESTNYYDKVLTYENFHEHLNQIKTIVIDFAGNVELLHQLNDLLKENLPKITLVGLTDWQSDKSFNSLANAKFFFAPEHVQIRYKTWGREKTQQLLNKSLTNFIAEIKNQIELEYILDLNTLGKLYLNMLKGNMNPQKCYLMRLK